MSAFRWLSGGAWAAARLHGVAVAGEALELAVGPGGRARRGVAVLAAGVPDQAQVQATDDDRWRRVVLRLAEPVPDGCWVRVWTRVDPAGGPDPADPDPLADDADSAPLPTPAGRWRAAAVDALDVRVLCAGPRPLWVGVEFGGDAAGTPRVADVRVESAADGPVTQLPVVYRGDLLDATAPVDSGDGFLGRFLGLLGAELARTGSVVDELPALLTPALSPDRPDAPWLERLAAWVALDPARLPRDDAARRESVATAVRRHGRRGTRDGLVDQVRRETGRVVDVVEPLAAAAVWRLDGSAGTSGLGVTTGLVTADPGPPALDRTAYLDASMLVTADDAGLPAHALAAHRICVHVPGGAAADVAAVDAVVQRERPAHVLARTCTVARRTGIPTVVGVDALPGPDPTGLADDVAHIPGVAGPGARVGASLPGPAPTDAQPADESTGDRR